MADPAFYGDTWAPIYDEVFTHLDPTAAVDVLAQLAGGGNALELGIGTGRVAIPLAGRGVAVHGLRLRERWGDWRRAPYTGSGGHVSIYERA